MDERTKRKLLPFTLFAACIAADQASKSLLVAAYPKDGAFIKDVFGNGLFWIIHQRNRAIAFSIGDSLPDEARAVLFMALPLAVIAGLVVYYFRSNEFSNLQRWATTAILGGGIGNLIDRFFRPDGVVDFISVNFYGFLGFSRWPTFNIADSCVVVGGLALLASVLFASPKEERRRGA